MKSVLPAEKWSAHIQAARLQLCFHKDQLEASFGP